MPFLLSFGEGLHELLFGDQPFADEEVTEAILRDVSCHRPRSGRGAEESEAEQPEGRAPEI